MKRIDMETHFLSKSLYKALKERTEAPYMDENDVCIFGPDCALPYGHMIDRLMDLGDGRIREMDQAGIDVQCISCVGGIETLPPEIGEEVAIESNNELYEAIQKYPDRYKGYAILAPHRVEKAVKELERCINEFGFIGWNAFSNFGEDALDDPKYRPLLKKCEELGAIVYIHPAMSTIERLHGLGRQLIASGMGFGIDTMITTERLMLTGVFDEMPNLKILLGHLGEGFPYVMDRMKIRGPLKNRLPAVNLKAPKEYLLTNIYIVTSGNYSEPALICGKTALGSDRIMLGSDYPMEKLVDSVVFLEKAGITDEERTQIYFENAQCVFCKSN